MRAFVALMFVSLGCAGCSKHHDSYGEAPRLKSLVAKNDTVLLKRFFDGYKIALPIPADKYEGGISSRWTAGALYAQPVTVETPDVAGSKMKGAVIDIVQSYWTVCCSPGREPDQGGKGEGEAVLDDDELLDLDSALGYMQTTQVLWAKEKPKVRTEVVYQSKDAFRVAIYLDGSYALTAGAAGITLDATQAAAFKANVEATMKMLHDN